MRSEVRPESDVNALGDHSVEVWRRHESGPGVRPANRTGKAVKITGFASAGQQGPRHKHASQVAEALG